jgi:hypothetical protein
MISPCSGLNLDKLGALLDDSIVVVVGSGGAAVLKEDERNTSKVAKLNKVRALLTLVRTQTAAIRQKSDELSANVAEPANLKNNLEYVKSLRF